MYSVGISEPQHTCPGEATDAHPGRGIAAFAPFTNEQLIGVVDQLLGAGSWTKFRHDAQGTCRLAIRPGGW